MGRWELTMGSKAKRTRRRGLLEEDGADSAPGKKREEEELGLGGGGGLLGERWKRRVHVAAPPSSSSAADDDEEEEDREMGSCDVNSHFPPPLPPGTAAVPFDRLEVSSGDDVLAPSRKTLIRPAQLLVVTRPGMALISWMRSWMPSSTEPFGEASR